MSPPRHGLAGRLASPKPVSVRYNDWRQVELPAPEAFTPTLPVSVIMPSFQTPPATLARTLASLEGQNYPRDLFEVVIVDDGSDPPVEQPRSTPLDVRVVRQERDGWATSRARNRGAREAAHDILLFLDADMLAETGWVMGHARWHHFVSDALTLGIHAHVSVVGLDADTIRRRTGSLRELFSSRPADPHWAETHWVRTSELTSRSDDLFRVVQSGNLGVGRDFYQLTGGFDESFGRWGMEDLEFGYRAYTRGALLVPVRDSFAWHQGRWKEDRDHKERSLRLQREKAAQHIPHPGFRREQPGRVFAVPQYIVTIEAGRYPAEGVINAAANILASRRHDLAVRIETRASHSDEFLTRLRDEFAADPRVRIAPAGSTLDEFPASPFHLALPPAVCTKDLVHRMRRRLGNAVTAISTLPDGSAVSLTRAWALHRARRTGKTPADFGDARTIRTMALKPRRAGPARYPARWRTPLRWMRDIRSPAHAWAFLKSLTTALRWRMAIRR